MLQKYIVQNIHTFRILKLEQKCSGVDVPIGEGLEKYEKWGLKIHLGKKTIYIGYGAETKDLILDDQKGCIRGSEEFQYLEIKIDKEDR